MDILKMLAELRAEREHIEQAIIVLEHLARGSGKRRGRPPKWMGEHRPEAGTKRTVSPEARKRMAEAQKKRWAAKKKEEAKE